jgi:acyl carrier protein
MGLESVELVLAIEEEFGIEIADADAVNLATPRMLADYVVARLGHPGVDEGRCLSQAGFYRIRAALVNRFGARRGDIRPESPIRPFLQGDLRKQWRELAEAIDAPQLPKLQCRKRVELPLILALPLATVLLLAWSGASAWAVLLAGLVGWIAGAGIADRLADQLPSEPATVAALVPYVRIPERAHWTPGYVLQRVIQITSVQPNIPWARIRPDDHFVEDLGLDS